MVRKLKTFQTSLGFFDPAVAAPSMKAALEAWGADSNLFHQGAAKESEDPNVVAATMAALGAVCTMCAPRDQRKSCNNQHEQTELNALRCQRGVNVSGGSNLVRQAANLRRLVAEGSIREMSGHVKTVATIDEKILQEREPESLRSRSEQHGRVPHASSSRPAADFISNVCFRNS
ncbi:MULTISPECIES: hypothetical protein [unclassified Bradyrhizobium]